MAIGVAFLAACGGDTTARTDTGIGATGSDTQGGDVGAELVDATSSEAETTEPDAAPEIAVDSASEEADGGTEPETTTTTGATDATAADVDSDSDTIPLDSGSPVDVDSDVPGETVTSETSDAQDPIDASDAVWPADRPQGQCARGADCPGALFCADTAPGGICNGCGTDPCPSDTSCNQFGACSRDCAGDADCPAGMRCHGTQEVCVLVGCAEASDCTPPYVCDANFCRRPSCAAGACPAPFVCVGDVCVEPYFSP